MQRKQKKMLYRIGVSSIIYIVLLLALHMLPAFAAFPIWAKVLLFLVPYLIIGYDILRKALLGLKNFQAFDENLLMCIATIAAFAIGEYAESVAVMLFYQVGELFQSYAVGKSRESITELMEIAPEYANLKTDEGVEEVDPDEVEVGDIIVVRPGEKVPIDGVVTEGESFLDTSPLTGESVPRKAAVGDEVISGSINGAGTLEIRTTKAFEDSTVARILELVEESGEKKARLEQFITRFARWYTPVVTISAFVLAVVPPLILGQPFGEWIHRACTFLIVSCPCALVISVPLGFFAGIGAASKQGILIKGGNYLEAVAGCDTFVFDKTGTLTKGEFSVKQVLPATGSGLDAGSLLAVAAAAERYSTHPIAGAIVAAAGGDILNQASGSGAAAASSVADDNEAAGAATGNQAMGVNSGIGISDHPSAGEIVAPGAMGKPFVGASTGAGAITVSEVAELAGRGIRCAVAVDGRDRGILLAGNDKLLTENHIAFEPCAVPGTCVYIAIDGKFAGSIVIDDELKENAAADLSRLRDCGVKRLVLLSGDRRAAAERMAREAGLDEAVAELLPADKVSSLEALMEKNSAGEKHFVAYVGDGINDAPVLMRADCGIAMGAAGSDAAIEAADIVLMDDGLDKLPRLMNLAKRVRRVVRQNIVFAIGVKFLVLILGALGIASLWMAVFADVGVAVLAILNSMRLLKVKGN